MDIPEDPQERKKWMMDLLKEYGREFLIFEPEDSGEVWAAAFWEIRDRLGAQRAGRFIADTISQFNK
jgi:hypothetical protein